MAIRRQVPAAARDPDWADQDRVLLGRGDTLLADVELGSAGDDRVGDFIGGALKSAYARQVFQGDAALLNTYAANVTQVILVREYTSVSIIGTAGLIPRAWDGTTGGVLAFLSQGAVNIVGSVTATSRFL